jgi:CheY-like chemotaxis protein
VVEDDPDLRSFLGEILRSLDYRVVLASDAATALEILSKKERPVGLLLTDIIMPSMNGRQLADQALREHPDLKVLYMTGYSRNAVVHQGRLDEGFDLLQKRFLKQNSPTECAWSWTARSGERSKGPVDSVRLDHDSSTTETNKRVFA